MRPIQALCDFLQARRPVARADAIARFGVSSVAALEAAGLVIPGPSLTSVRCRLCDGNHVARIFPEANGFSYHCVEAGSVGAAQVDDLATLIADCEVAVRQLCVAIGGWRPDFPARPLIVGRLWRLGETQLSDRRIRTCFLALRAIDGAVIETLARDAGPQGLVLTTADDPGNPAFSEIGSHRVVGLADIADVDRAGVLRVDQRAIEGALEMRSMAKRGAGRTPKGLREALASIPSLSDAALTLPTADILHSLRSQSVPLCNWLEPPDKLVRAVDEQVAAERRRRGLAG